MRILSDSKAKTMEIGTKVGRLLKRGDVVALIGELGSGKTVFTKGIAGGLRISDVRYVNSPSFVIVKEHKGKIPLYHFDIFRLNKPDSLYSIGYDEYFYGNGITVIEWAEKIEGLLPREHLKVEISFVNPTSRIISIRGTSKRFKSLINELGGQFSDWHGTRSPIGSRTGPGKR